jgi:hypothetical protein
MPFIVVYDANVLIGNTQRDLMVRIAQTGLAFNRIATPCPIKRLRWHCVGRVQRQGCACRLRAS